MRVAVCFVTPVPLTPAHRVVSNYDVGSRRDGLELRGQAVSRSGLRARPHPRSYRPSRVGAESRLGAPFSVRWQPAGGESGEGSEDRGLDRLQDWLTAAGVELRHAEVRGAGSQRGLYATQAVEAGTDVVRVPRACALVISMVPSDPPSDLQMLRVQGDTFWSSAPWYVRLAVRLLDEVAQGACSSFAPYIAMLPANPQAGLWAMHGPDSDADAQAKLDQYKKVRAQLTRYGLQSAAVAYDKRIREYFRAFRAALSPLQRPCISLRTFVWAICIVVSRSFGLPPSPYQPMPTSASAAASIKGEKQTQDAIPLNAATMIDTSRDGQHFNPTEYALFPGLDMANHWARAGTSLRYDAHTDTFCVRSGTNTAAGDQVFVSYGTRGNDDFVFFYGFVEAYNPNNEVRIYGAREWVLGLAHKTDRKNREVKIDRKDNDEKENEKGDMAKVENEARDGVSWDRKLSVLRDAGLVSAEAHFSLRVDALHSDLMRVLRLALATADELQAIEQHVVQPNPSPSPCSFPSPSSYKALGKALSLRNELACWAALEEHCEEMRCSPQSDFTVEQQNRLRSLLQHAPQEACSAVWEWGIPDNDGELLYRLERSRILEATVDRLRHFANISKAVGRVCTVLMPPSQSTLRAEVFDHMTKTIQHKYQQPHVGHQYEQEMGGMNNMLEGISPDDIQRQIKNGRNDNSTAEDKKKKKKSSR